MRQLKHLLTKFASANVGVKAAAIFPFPEKSKNKMYWYSFSKFQNDMLLLQLAGITIAAK